MISPPKAPALLVNPRSGGGKAQHHDLVARCRACGIEPLPLEPGEDISAVATAAVLCGADVIGMAGGDGSQAAAAAVAAEHDVPYVVVPAGTRNHFALDLGVDPDDVVGSLAAFSGGEERRVDLARVNGRVFVNNASMGLYGSLVQSSQYRDAKLRTVIEMLPELLGPRAEPFDLRFTDAEGSEHVGAELLLVSNNRYELDPLGARGARGGIDKGTLGVVAVHLAPPVSRQVWEWAAPEFRVSSGGSVDVGLDGEAVTLEPPLVFESLPSVLRARTIDHRRKNRGGWLGTPLQAGKMVSVQRCAER
jgi:diacylglycerol kinase family enzyme